MNGSTSTRRQFLRTAGGGAVAASLTPPRLSEALAETVKHGEMPYRPLGKTGQKVSIICLGGYHIGKHDDEAEGLRIIDTAIDAGINFLDNAWKYNRGRSEERMGKALKGAKRDKVFLMTKSNKRTKAGAMRDLEDSLRRLQTDRLDLWQVHEIARNDPRRVFGPDGAIEAFLQARKQGKVRFIGFTGHANPKWHREMLDQDFEFATVQMALNPLDYHYESFEKHVLPEAVKRGMGVIAMKTLAFGKLPRAKHLTSQECWRYVLSQPVTTVCTGCESMEDVHRVIAFARSFSPMSKEEITALRDRTKDLARNGQLESYKQTAHAGCPSSDVRVCDMESGDTHPLREDPHPDRA